MTEASEMTVENVMAWIADNPTALRHASAQAAADLLGGPVIQAALTALKAAIIASQDSEPKEVGQPSGPGAVGSAQSLQRVVYTITLGRAEITARLAMLSPPVSPDANSQAEGVSA